MANPKLTLPDDVTPEQLADVLERIVVYIRNTVFTDDRATAMEAPFNPVAKIKELGYEKDADKLWQLMKVTGAATPTGRRVGRRRGRVGPLQRPRREV